MNNFCVSSRFGLLTVVYAPEGTMRLTALPTKDKSLLAFGLRQIHYKVSHLHLQNAALPSPFAASANKMLRARAATNLRI